MSLTWRRPISRRKLNKIISQGAEIISLALRRVGETRVRDKPETSPPKSNDRATCPRCCARFRKLRKLRIGLCRTVAVLAFHLSRCISFCRDQITNDVSRVSSLTSFCIELCALLVCFRSFRSTKSVRNENCRVLLAGSSFKTKSSKY